MLLRPPRSTLFPYNDALPIFPGVGGHLLEAQRHALALLVDVEDDAADLVALGDHRSEEHTSELQSRQYLVCRLLLEKKNNKRSASSYIDLVVCCTTMAKLPLG